MAHEDKRLKRRVLTSYFVSTVSIAMVLFLLGAVTYLVLNALNATNRLRESVMINVMLADGLPEEEKAALRTQIEAQEVVREVVFVSKDEAAEKFIAESGEDFRGFIDFNPLPDSFEVGLEAHVSEKEPIEKFVDAVEAMPGVDEVVYQKGVVEQIGTNLGKLNLVILLFGGAMLVISLILLNNTIRMTIIAKRRIINTMKLVGANGGFIMRPFLGSAALHGIYAGLIATVLFAVMIVGLGEGLPELQLLKSNALFISIAGGMIVMGVVISLLFTVFAVDKAVRQQSAKALI